MYRIDYAVMVIAGTLALVAAAITAFLWIRHRLSNDPDMQEFMERVDRGRAGDDCDDDAEDGSSVGEDQG